MTAQDPASVGELRTAARELAERREYDAAALRIIERIRSSLALDEVLQLTIDEIGNATTASRSLIELAPNEEGVARMLEWDRGDTRPLGLRPPTPIGRRVIERRGPLIIGDRAELEDDEIRAYLDAVGTVSTIAYPLLWRGHTIAVLALHDSRPRAWRDHAEPLLQRVADPLAAAIVQSELFEQQQRALEELRTVSRMREELIANVSHELRTPLTAMIGSIKTLRREDVPPTEHGGLLAVLDEQAERLALLTEDLLDLSRFHGGRRELNLARWRFSELFRRVERELALPHGRSIDLQCDDDLELVVDGERVLQVLSNLLVNAIRHGAGDVHVSCFAENGEVLVHVTDEGEGVAADYADEMFLPFSHRSDRSDSTGLGLPISRAIVEAHGGTLVYIPATAGERHQFVVRLPRVASASATADPS